MQCDLKLIAFQSMSYLFGFYGQDEMCLLHILTDNVEKVQSEMQRFVTSLGVLENIPKGVF